MKIHHLNCGSMQPWSVPDGLVCHVLLLETPRSLVLVDSGFGLHDIANPAQRLGPIRHLIRPSLQPHEAAIFQVERLGYQAKDVRHIVLTHFDADHVGGLADFPWAQVHLTAAEAFAMQHPKRLLERGRYRPAARAHGPKLVEHAPARGDAWRGFAAVCELSEIAEDLLLVSLPGHSHGHAAVAANAGNHWVFHVGDAFYHRAQLDVSAAPAPRTLTTMERVVAVDWSRVQENHQRLRELWDTGDPAMRLVNAHDPTLLRAAQAHTPHESPDTPHPLT